MHRGCLDWTFSISMRSFLRKSPPVAPVQCELVKLYQQQDCWYELKKNLLLTSAFSGAAIREACARTGCSWKSMNSSTESRERKLSPLGSGSWVLGQRGPLQNWKQADFWRKLWLSTYRLFCVSSIARTRWGLTLSHAMCGNPTCLQCCGQIMTKLPLFFLFDEAS